MVDRSLLLVEPGRAIEYAAVVKINCSAVHVVVT